MTLLLRAAETAISGVHKLPGTGEVPTSKTSLFWPWLAVSSVLTGQSARTSYSQVYPIPPPFSPALIGLMVSVDVKTVITDLL